MKKSLLIYGAGGLGREVLSMIKGSDEWNPLGFIDDVTPPGKIINGLAVKGNASWLNDIGEDIYVIIAIGDPIRKATIYSSIRNPHIQFPVLKHASAILQDEEHIQIGEGCILTAGVILTTNIRLGKHVLLNLNTTVGHDTRIDDYASVMTSVNIAGGVSIGARALIGSGACIKNDILIGEESRVGMGAVVVRDVASRITVAGVPAKPL
ncbi:MAG TPA: acetyltransferase [Ohtaekwangia sp.]|uniref:acetyltransferase n=1 Tax=Ohtaekwangia sp. TaxID=2066019 RepID=UPI002F955813